MNSEIFVRGVTSGERFKKNLYCSVYELFLSENCLVVTSSAYMSIFSAIIIEKNSEDRFCIFI